MGQRHVRGRQPARAPRRRAPQGARRADLGDLPGPADQPASALQDRVADLRDDPGARPVGLEEGGDDPDDRAASAGGHPEARHPGERLPAPVLGRHAAARDDRDGPRPRAQAHHRRRAHHGARRDRPGPDSGPAAAAAAGHGHGADHDHPRPRGGRRHRRRRAGHVRGPGGREGAQAGDLLPPAPPVHQGAARVDPVELGGRRTAQADPRPAAQPDQPPGRVQVPPALRLRVRQVQDRGRPGAPPGRRRRRARVGLLAAGRLGRPVGRGRGAPAGDGEARPRAGPAQGPAVGRHRAPDSGATAPGPAANNEGSVA